MPFVRDIWSRVSAALGQGAVSDVQAADDAYAPDTPPAVDDGQVAVIFEKDGARTWVVLLDTDARHIVAMDGQSWHHVAEHDGHWIYVPL